MDPDGDNAKQVTNLSTEADGVVFSGDGKNLVNNVLNQMAIAPRLVGIGVPVATRTAGSSVGFRIGHTITSYGYVGFMPANGLAAPGPA